MLLEEKSNLQYHPATNPETYHSNLFARHMQKWTPIFFLCVCVFGCFQFFLSYLFGFLANESVCEREINTERKIVFGWVKSGENLAELGKWKKYVQIENE